MESPVGKPGPLPKAHPRTTLPSDDLKRSTKVRSREPRADFRRNRRTRDGRASLWQGVAAAGAGQAEHWPSTPAVDLPARRQRQVPRKRCTPTPLDAAEREPRAVAARADWSAEVKDSPPRAHAIDTSLLDALPRDAQGAYSGSGRHGRPRRPARPEPPQCDGLESVRTHRPQSQFPSFGRCMRPWPASRCELDATARSDSVQAPARGGSAGRLQPGDGRGLAIVFESPARACHAEFFRG